VLHLAWKHLNFFLEGRNSGTTDLFQCEFDLCSNWEVGLIFKLQS
jgi:hypothetical protein